MWWLRWWSPRRSPRRRILRSWCAVLLTGVSVPAWAQGLPSASPQAIGLVPEVLPRVTAGLRAYVDAGKLAGIVAVIARDGRVGYAQAIGHLDRAAGTPMRTDAVFRIYSLTKPIIAVAILQLVEQGRLRLDDPVTMYIPAFESTAVYVGGGASRPAVRPPTRPITIHDLLTHTAGLSYGGFGSTPVDSIYQRASPNAPGRSTREFADRLAALPLLTDPGSAWNYGMGYELLGAIIEVVTGRTLDVHLDSAIFRPLGMRETGFRVTPAMAGRIPVVHYGALRPVRPMIAERYRPTARFLSGGGGLLSTPGDYLRFAQMLLDGGQLDGVRVLTEESVRSMMENQLPPSLTPIVSPLIGDRGYGQGLGGVVRVDPTLSTLPGSAGIYRWWGSLGTFFWVDPRTKLIGLVWTQYQPGRAYPIEQDFQRLVYAAVSR